MGNDQKITASRMQIPQARIQILKMIKSNHRNEFHLVFNAEVMYRRQRSKLMDAVKRGGEIQRQKKNQIFYLQSLVAKIKDVLNNAVNDACTRVPNIKERYQQLVKKPLLTYVEIGKYEKHIRREIRLLNYKYLAEIERIHAQRQKKIPQIVIEEFLELTEDKQQILLHSYQQKYPQQIREYKVEPIKWKNMVNFIEFQEYMKIVQRQIYCKITHAEQMIKAQKRLCC